MPRTQLYSYCLSDSRPPAAVLPLRCRGSVHGTDIRWCLICWLPQAIMMRVEGAIVGHDQRIFNCLMKVFESPSATAHAEAYMAMGALANAIESRFTEYFKVFYPVLCRGLAATTEHQVCFVAVGVIGDVCRAMEAATLPYTTPLVDGLVTNLRNKMLERTVKPAMLSAFGDLALAVGPSFPPDRIEPAMQMLIDASKTTVPVRSLVSRRLAQPWCQLMSLDVVSERWRRGLVGLPCGSPHACDGRFDGHDSGFQRRRQPFFAYVLGEVCAH